MKARANWRTWPISFPENAYIFYFKVFILKGRGKKKKAFLNKSRLAARAFCGVAAQKFPSRGRQIKKEGGLFPGGSGSPEKLTWKNPKRG